MNFGHNEKSRSRNVPFEVSLLEAKLSPGKFRMIRLTPVCAVPGNFHDSDYKPFSQQLTNALHAEKQRSVDLEKI